MVVSDVGACGASTRAVASRDGALLLMLMMVILLLNMLNFHGASNASFISIFNLYFDNNCNKNFQYNYCFL